MIKTIIIGLGNIGIGYDLNKKNNAALTHVKSLVKNKENFGVFIHLPSSHGVGAVDQYKVLDKKRGRSQARGTNQASPNHGKWIF